MITKHNILFFTFVLLLCLYDFFSRVYMPLGQNDRAFESVDVVFQVPKRNDNADLLERLNALAPAVQAKQAEINDNAYLQFDGKQLGNNHISLIGIYGKAQQYTAVVAVKHSGTKDHRVVRLIEGASLDNVLVQRVTNNRLVVSYNDEITTLQLFKPVRDNT